MRVFRASCEVQQDRKKERRVPSYLSTGVVQEQKGAFTPWQRDKGDMKRAIFLPDAGKDRAGDVLRSFFLFPPPPPSLLSLSLISLSFFFRSPSLSSSPPSPAPILSPKERTRNMPTVNHQPILAPVHPFIVLPFGAFLPPPGALLLNISPQHMTKQFRVTAPPSAGCAKGVIEDKVLQSLLPSHPFPYLRKLIVTLPHPPPSLVLLPLLLTSHSSLSSPSAPSVRAALAEAHCMQQEALQ